MTDVLLLQLPSPPFKNVFREWAGGMGTALPTARDTWGHDQQFYDVPYSPFLYIARRLGDAGIGFAYRDLQSDERLGLDAFDALLATEAPRTLVAQINLPSLEHDLALLARARRLLPGLRILLLGAVARWFRDRILRDGHADVVMEEQEELATSDNVAALLAGTPERLAACHVLRDGAAVTLPARARMADLDFVAFPAYELLDFTRYESSYYFGVRQRYATVFTTKGCPYKCGYCPYPYGFGKRLIYRSPALVGQDIARLKQEFGVQQILFRDQVFTINPRHVRAVCEELIARDLGMAWLCETRYDLVDEPLLDLMARAGCREIHYGLESADEEMFAAVAKSDGPKSLPLFARVIGWTQARGMRAHVHLILGMPDESRATVRHTTAWLRRVKPDSVQIGYYTPYPGTPMFEALKASGELGDIGAIDWESLTAFTGPVIPTRHLSIPEIRRARA
ncbi:MAG: B12-binding domain-containing radical SAM protein, partial [Acetobacteraceae bacterium]